MNITAWMLIVVYLATVLFIFTNAGLNLSLSSVLLNALLILHGPMYLYYTRVWGPETDFFYRILSAAGGYDVITTMDIALIFVFIGVCLGIKFADLLSGLNGIDIRHAIATWPDTKFGNDELHRNKLHSTLLIIIFFVLLPFVIYEGQLQKVIEYVTADIGEFGKIALRRDHGGSKVYLYNLLCANFFPFIAFLGLVTYKKEQLCWKLAIVFFILLLLLSKIATLSKAPAAIFLVQCFLVWMMNYRLKLNFKLLISVSFLSFALIVCSVVVANVNLVNIDQIFSFLFYRLFMIPNESLLEYFSAIPYAIDFSWGSSLSWLTQLLQGEQRLPTYWLVGEVHRGVMGSTTNVMFAGDAWADFSWFGLVTYPIFLGALVRFIDRTLLVRWKKTAATIAALALGQYGLFIAMNTALPTALLTGGLLFVLPFAAIFSYTSIDLIWKNFINYLSMFLSNSKFVAVYKK